MPSSSELPMLAQEVGVPERTLRRAVARGTLRARRPGPRRFELAAGEHRYLRENWDVLSTIAEVLRTERNVRLAVVFGSTARGTARADSDIDVLVDVAQPRPLYLAHLTARLTRALDHDVDMVALESLREHEPGLLASILDEGRPVIDRDGTWVQLRRDSADIERAARRVRAERSRRTAAAIASLMGE